MALRRKGDREWHRLPGSLSEIEVAIEHVGPGRAKEWTFRLQALQLTDLRRVVDLRAGLTKEDAPQLWERNDSGQLTYTTPDGRRDQLELISDILRECCAGIRGHPDGEACKTAEERAQFLSDIAADDYLIGPVLEQQALMAPLPLVAGPGDVPAERPAPAELGPGDRVTAGAGARDIGGGPICDPVGPAAGVHG